MPVLLGPAAGKGAGIRVVATCRGEGVGYAALSSETPCSDLSVRAHAKDGASVPCTTYPVASAALRRVIAAGAPFVWVVAFPLLTRDVSLEVTGGGETLLQTALPVLQSKVASRLLTKKSPQVAAALRGYEQRFGAGLTQVQIEKAWPATEGQAVWRVRVVYPTQRTDVVPLLRAFDERACEVPQSVVVMEDHVVPSERDESRLVRLVTFSCTLPESLTSFYLVAGLGDDPAFQGFAGMNAPRGQALLVGGHVQTAGAAGNDRYPQWFEEHRATAAELAWQRAQCKVLSANQKPLISIVMPVFKPAQEFLLAAIASVCAQSYDHWELVLANASGACAEVDGVLASFHDDRIRVLRIPNHSISQNTNEGIQAARGDYVCFMDHDDVLEPDALWCFAQVVAAHPQVDLLYCDEDHLQEGGVHAPAFKTFPNLGKLYSHNYITHLLMVSRWALEHTERSCPEVAGAQDYDLTLKTFEVAREVVQVPRVLYHWREHEGSTSGGGNQKPFAHEAGRRALTAHLERRGIAARVEDGVLPYTYRVRYELPQPLPKVSVVIPTRDQAHLLRICVISLLDKTTYPNYEVVLVENNSTDPATFQLYQELQALSDRVRLCTWEPPEPGTFNYSTLVNFGVAQSQGDLVVLLNNDTEVLEPTWLEEMAGCLMRPEVGVVGAKLLFGDDLIQHVGMAANPDGGFCHVCQNVHRDALGPGYAAMMPGDCSMVTGACQMVSRALFDELGGYDERLAVGFNDGDFCLRARERGFATTVCAQALLRHREFSTRGREATDVRLRARYVAERAYMMERHAQFFAQGDPLRNPNLNQFDPYFDLPQ